MVQSKVKRTPLLENVTSSPFTGEAKDVWQPSMSFQLSGRTTSGAGTATVVVEASNEDGASANWLQLGTITLALVDSGDVSDGFSAPNAAWARVRMRVTDLTGTGASLDGSMGMELN